MSMPEYVAECDECGVQGDSTYMYYCEIWESDTRAYQVFCYECWHNLVECGEIWPEGGDNE
jgi:hypothetical protein